VKNNRITPQNLCYYFDSIEQDATDHRGASERAAQLLAVREQLLTLTSEEFAAVLHSLRGMLQGLRPQVEARSEQKAQRKLTQQVLLQRVGTTKPSIKETESIHPV
jgi:signal transduction histidine kinase